MRQIIGDEEKNALNGTVANSLEEIEGEKR
jgi:hypothetical protein